MWLKLDLYVNIFHVSYSPVIPTAPSGKWKQATVSLLTLGKTLQPVGKGKQGEAKERPTQSVSEAQAAIER